MSEPFDIEALLESAAPRTLQVAVCARGDLVDRHLALVQALKAAEEKASGSLSGDPEVQRIAEEIVAVEEEQEASTLTLTFHSVSRKQWADCLGQHPPRKGRDLHDYNAETFPPAAVALCCDEVTEEQAVKLAEVLPQGEWERLWQAAIGLNVTGTPHPKLRAATELARVNGNSSISQEPSASPGQRSSAGSGEQ